MPTTKTWAGSTFNLPLNREPKGSWGTEVSNFLIALANNALALTGGTQTLSAELNFGATYGIVSTYIKSAAANIASAGVVRLAKTDTVSWRNNANSADLTLGVNASDQLTFNGTAIQAAGSYLTALTGDVTASGPGSAAATVAQVGGKSASAVAQSVTDTTAATNANTVSTIVKRDGSGNFSAGTITAALSGNATTATTAGNVSGTVAIANGGTGQTTANAALNALLPSQSSSAGKVLSTDGSNTSWASAASSTLTAQYTDIGNASNSRTATNTALLGSIQANSGSQTATITIATPGVLTVTAAPATGDTVYLTTTGSLPTGLSASTTYYAINVSSTTLKLATTRGNALAGTAIATSGTQSGTHTLFTGGLTVGPNGLPGNISGSAVPTGYVGEIFQGTLHGNASGFSYSTRSTTALTSSFATVISITLNKGVYLVSYYVSCNSSTTTSIAAELTVAGTAVSSNPGFAVTTAGGAAFGALPVVITADGTTVGVLAEVGTGSTSANAHEMWAVRIA